MSMLDPQTVPFGAGAMAPGEVPLGNDQAASREGAGEAPPKEDFSLRVRQWYLEAINASVWKNWIAEADEDTGFYVGGKGQWSHNGKTTDYDKLISEKRAAVSINHCQSILDVLSGYERSNRMDLKAMPQGDGDVKSAQLMSFFLKYAQEQTETQDKLSEMFEDGNIRGMDMVEVGIDYSGERPINGEIAVDKLAPGKDVIWDPFWTKYDLSDARYILKFRWSFLLDLCAEFPEHKAALIQAVGQLRQVFASNNVTTATTGGDNYGYVREHPIESLDEERQFYAAGDDRLLIIEAWYHVYYTRFSVYDLETGKDEECRTFEEAAKLRDSNPSRLRLHRKETRRVRMATIIPATYTTIEEDKNPFPNDDSNYPQVLYICKRKGDAIFGVIRNLKDPQRIENKRWSQVIDLLGKWADIRPLVPKGSLTNPTALDDASSSGPIEYNKEQGPPTWFVAPVAAISAPLEMLATQMKLTIREISGVNTDLLGEKHDTASGIAIARRQQQGMTIASVLFDNLRRSRKLVGQRLARRIQQVYTAEDTIRMTNDYGAPVVVRINPMGANSKALMGDEEYGQWSAQNAGDGMRTDPNAPLKPAVLRDVTSLKYDIVVSEAPSTPTARAAALMSLLEIAEKVPAIAPALLDYIIELADVPNREELIQRVRRLIPPQVLGMAPMGGAPPNPAAGPETPGTPPGMPAGPPPGPPPAGAVPAMPIAA